MSADKAKTHKLARPFKQDRDIADWHGRYTPYDLAKEGLIALVVVVLLVTGLAVLFGSPDDTPVTVKSWSTANAVDFAATAIAELDGTSGTATYNYCIINVLCCHASPRSNNATIFSLN